MAGTDDIDAIRERANEARRAGRTTDAVRELLAAIEQQPAHWPLRHDLGLALAEDGRPADAIEAYRQALALGGAEQAGPWVNLGNALRCAGRKTDAIEAYRTALDLDDRLAPAHYNMHAALYDERDPSAALHALGRAAELRPDHVETRFFLGALRQIHHGSGESLLAALPDRARFLVESLRFVEAERRPGTRLFADTFDTLAHAVRLAPLPGLVVELGVRHGTTLRFLAAACPGSSVHGHDSFEGLPLPWGGRPAGLYTTDGEAPAVGDGVRLHRGRFCDTIGPMLARQPEPLALVHVDCDLYASTKEALQALGSRIVAGTVLVFDEYLCNPGWQAEEHLAWQQAVHDYELDYEPLSFSLFTKQAVVRVRSVAGRRGA